MGRALKGVPTASRRFNCSPRSKRRGVSSSSKDVDDAPAPKPSRDLTELEKDTLANIWLYFEQNPDEILTHFAGLHSNKKRGAKTGSSKPADELKWNPGYLYWKQISKHWLANLLEELTDLDKDDLDNIDEADLDGIRHLCTYFFGIHVNDKFPRACIEKRVMRAFLLAMGQALGKRWTKFRKAVAVNRDYTVNYDVVTPYTFISSEDGTRVNKVAHDILSDDGAYFAEVQQGIDLDQSWQFIDCYGDRTAQVKKGIMKPHLEEFFYEAPKWEEFAKLFGPAHQKEVADKIRETMDEQDKAVKLMNVNKLAKADEKMKEAKKQKMKAVLAKPKKRCAVAVRMSSNAGQPHGASGSPS